MLHDLEDLMRQHRLTGSEKSALQRLALVAARKYANESSLKALQDRVLYQDLDPLTGLAVCQAAIQQSLSAKFQIIDFRRYQCFKQSHVIATVQDQGTGFEFQLLPGGRFSMGAETLNHEDSVRVLTSYTLWEHYHSETEQPRHEVVVRPFLLGRYPVTKDQWPNLAQRGLAILAETPGVGQGGEAPVFGISHASALRTLKSLNPLYQLPSEAQWEYACRAGTDTHYFWGDAFDPDFCWFKGNSLNGPQSWREHADKTNAFGLIDMLGNVKEWCADDWIPHYASGPDDDQARSLKARRREKVRRGGDWSSDAGECRSAARDFRHRRYQQPGNGIRIMISLY